MKTRIILSVAVVGLTILLAAQAKSSPAKIQHNVINSTMLNDSVPLKTKVITAVKERRKKTSRFPAKKAQ